MKLKHFSLLLSLIFIVFVSCNQNSKETNPKVNDTSAKTITSNVVKADTTLSIENVPITPLPFGSDVLATYKFPKILYPPDPLADDSIPVGPDEKHFGEVSEQNAKRDHVKHFRGPEILYKSYTYLDGDSLIIQDRRKLENDFEYRLPDMDGYQCYYMYRDYRSMEGHDYMDYRSALIQTKDKKCFVEIGSIVLYDRKTKSANIINVTYNFFYNVDNFSSTMRIFYIDANKTIKIFRCDIGEGVVGFKETQEINVLDDGKIVVKNLK